MAIDIGGQVSSLFGGFSFGSFWNILGYGILLLVLVAVVGFFLKRWITNKRFSESIVFWVKNPLTNSLVADKTIKAMLVRLDSFGNLGYRLQTPYATRNLLPKLKYEVKPHVHYVEYCEDGRIVEMIGIADYDRQRREYKATFTDQNTELGRSSLHQMNKERYEKTSFWKEHATLLVNIGAIVVIMVFLWLIADKLIDVLGSIGGLLDKTGTLQTAQSNIIDSLNRLLVQHNLNPATIVANVTA